MYKEVDWKSYWLHLCPLLSKNCRLLPQSTYFIIKKTWGQRRYTSCPRPNSRHWQRFWGLGFQSWVSACVHRFHLLGTTCFLCYFIMSLITFLIVLNCDVMVSNPSECHWGLCPFFRVLVDLWLLWPRQYCMRLLGKVIKKHRVFALFSGYIFHWNSELLWSESPYPAATCFEETKLPTLVMHGLSGCLSPVSPVFEL